MLTDFFFAIEEYDLENMWFQQDAATFHTTRANMALLPETLPGRVISRRFDIIRLFSVMLRERSCLCR